MERKLQKADSEEAGLLSPSGFKEKAKGFNWILNYISSLGRFEVLCGFFCKHKRQLYFEADLYHMVVGLFQSVAEKYIEKSATEPCNFSS